MEPLVFRRWSNKGWSVHATLHRVIRIATLCLAYNILHFQPILGQADTTKPAIYLELEEVQAIGDPSEAELYSPLLRQLILVNNEQLESRSQRSLDEILSYQPGVDIRTRGPNGIQSDMSILGGSFDQNMVLLNGIDMSNPQTGHFSLDLPLDLTGVDQLEILKGPAARLYGLNAYSGALNVATQPRDSLEMHVEMAYGQHATWRSAAGFHVPAGITRTLLVASASASDGYMPNTDYRSDNLFLHTVAETGPVKSEIMFGWNQKDFGAATFYTPRYPEQYEETGSILAAAKFTADFSKLDLHANIHWRQHNDHFTLFRNNPAWYENYHRSRSAGISAGGSIRSAAGITKVDANFRYDGILSTTLGDPLSEPVKVKGTDSAYFDHSGIRNQFTISLDHRLQLGRFYAGAGALIHTGAGSLSSAGIYPGIDLSFELTGKTQLFFSANRSMRLPTFTDLYYEGPQNRGNPNLEPEKAITVEGGSRTSGKLLVTEISGFYRSGRSTIDWIWEDSTWQTRNLTELTAYGGEIRLQLRPSTILRENGFREKLAISYSYVALNKESNSFISNYALDNLKHKLTIDLSVDFPLGFYIQTHTAFRDRNGYFLFYKTPEATPYEKAYDPYWTMDVTAGIRLRGITLYADIRNLTDTRYRDIGSMPMPGRWIMAGVKLRK